MKLSVSDLQLKLILKQLSRRKIYETRLGDIIKHVDGKFVCRNCSRITNTLGSMRTHMSQDCPNTTNSFYCTICQRSYKRKYSFKQHLIYVHNVKV